MSPSLSVTDPAFVADPFPVFELLREQAPLHWDDENGT